MYARSIVSDQIFMDAHNYDDLQRAIATVVFKRHTQDTPIIGGNEQTPVDWLFDFRSLILQPEWLNRYAEIFWEHFGDDYPFQVCGMETAAIALIAAIVMKGVERNTPVNGLYIRKSRKRQGLLRQIEGTPNNEKIILVDDLINSASTFNKQIKVLRDAHQEIFHIFAFLSFREKSTYLPLNIPVTTLFVLPDFGLPYEKSHTASSTEKFEILWKYSARRPIRNYVHEKSNPVLNGDFVYFGTDSEGLVALDRKLGSAAWRSNLGNEDLPSTIFTTVRIQGEAIFAGSDNGNFCSLDKKTGAIRWIYTGADRIRSSPTLAPKSKAIFVGLEYGLMHKGGALAALDMHTGAKRWITNLPGRVRATPLYSEKEDMVIVGDDVGNVSGYSATDGSPRFHCTIKGGSFGGFTYDEKRRTIYFGSTSGVLYGVFIPTGEIVFTKQTLGIYSTPTIAGDILYFSSLDKRIYAINLSDHSERWRFATQGRIFASPLIIEGSLWCGSNDGKLYELDPETGTLRSSFQFSERIVGSIVYDQKTRRFFVPTQANELYCLKRKDFV